MKTMNFLFFVLHVFLALSFSFTFAYDPSPLQNVCIAVNEPKDAVFVNGKFCKNPKHANPNDFSFSGLHIPGNTTNAFGPNSTIVTVDQLPGLNTLGLSLARTDYSPGGVNPLHHHPRGAEMFVVLEGTLYAGFIASDPENRLIAKVLKKGEVFAIPMGLFHFQFNMGQSNAVTITAINSQNPDVVNVKSVFETKPTIPKDILAKNFRMDMEVIERILQD